MLCIMEESLFTRYLEIRQKTYHIVESKGIKYIQSMTKDISLKELSLLFAVEYLKETEENKPTFIGQYLGLALNHLTYYLNQLRKRNVLEKIVNEKDQRESFIFLTEKGKEALSYYQIALSTAASEVQKSLSVIDKFQLVKALRTIAYPATSVQQAPSFTRVIKDPRQMTQIMINRIHQSNINEDLAFLNEKAPDISLKELRILLEIFIQSHQQQATLLSVVEELGLPLSTLGRIIDQSKFVEKKAATHDHRIKYLSIKKNHHSLFYDFMNLRIARYENTKKLAGKKPFKLIEKLFESLETFIDQHTIE